MDPDANLRELRALADAILQGEGTPADCRRAVRLAELVEALDGWLSGGGFLPRKWERKS